MLKKQRSFQIHLVGEDLFAGQGIKPLYRPRIVPPGQKIRVAQVGVFNRGGGVVECAAYGDEWPWPVVADGGGPSLQRLSLAAFADTWANWTTLVKDETGRKGKALFMPLSQAVTGMERGPQMADVMPLLQTKPKLT